MREKTSNIQGYGCLRGWVHVPSFGFCWQNKLTLVRDLAAPVLMEIWKRSKREMKNNKL